MDPRPNAIRVDSRRSSAWSRSGILLDNTFVQGDDGTIKVFGRNDELHIDLSHALAHGKNVDVGFGQSIGGFREETRYIHIAADRGNHGHWIMSNLGSREGIIDAVTQGGNVTCFAVDVVGYGIGIGVLANVADPKLLEVLKQPIVVKISLQVQK